MPEDCGERCLEYFLLRAVMRIRRFLNPDRLIVKSEGGLSDAFAGILAKLPLSYELDNSSLLFNDIPSLSGGNAGFAEIDGDSLKIHKLTLPKELKLIDCHVHTKLAYCQENLETPLIFAMAEASGLSKFIFTEHSGHLYLGRDDYNRAAYYKSGLSACHIQSRMRDYKSILSSCPAGAFISGMELDCDASGTPVVIEKDLEGIAVKLGAVHHLESSDQDGAFREFMRVNEKLIKSGIDVLAHPFRVFQRKKLPKPEYLYNEIASMLAENNVAAELNFHTNSPEEDFFGHCIEKGVKIVLGSDSHNLYEVGDLNPHLDFLEKIRPGSSLEKILWKPENERILKWQE